MPTIPEQLAALRALREAACTCGYASATIVSSAITLYWAHCPKHAATDAVIDLALLQAEALAAVPCLCGEEQDSHYYGDRTMHTPCQRCACVDYQPNDEVRRKRWRAARNALLALPLGVRA